VSYLIFSYDSFAVLFFPEIVQLVAAVGGVYRRFSRLPVSGAYFTVLVCVLKRFDQAEDFFNVAADGKVTDTHVSQNSVSIDNVSGAEGNAGVRSVFYEAAIVTSYVFSEVRNHGDVHRTKATLLPGLLCVLHMGEVRVDGATDHLRANLLELGSAVRELTNFSWAHKSEVEGPEKQDNVPS
jgi:hypothetical protein